MSILSDWKNGDISSQDALQALCQSLATLQDRLEPLKETEKVLRNQISEVVEALGGKSELAGFGKLEITSPSVVATYKRDKLDRLVTQLTLTHPDIARQIAECREESGRAGGLRITQAKPPRT